MQGLFYDQQLYCHRNHYDQYEGRKQKGMHCNYLFDLGLVYIEEGKQTLKVDPYNCMRHTRDGCLRRSITLIMARTVPEAK